MGVSIPAVGSVIAWFGLVRAIALGLGLALAIAAVIAARRRPAPVTPASDELPYAPTESRVLMPINLHRAGGPDDPNEDGCVDRIRQLTEPAMFLDRPPDIRPAPPLTPPKPVERRYCEACHGEIAPHEPDTVTAPQQIDDDSGSHRVDGLPRLFHGRCWHRHHLHHGHYREVAKIW